MKICDQQPLHPNPSLNQYPLDQIHKMESQFSCQCCHSVSTWITKNWDPFMRNAAWTDVSCRSDEIWKVLMHTGSDNEPSLVCWDMTPTLGQKLKNWSTVTSLSYLLVGNVHCWRFLYEKMVQDPSMKQSPFAPYPCIFMGCPLLQRHPKKFLTTLEVPSSWPLA